MDDEFKTLSIDEFLKGQEFDRFTSIVLIGILKEPEASDLYVASNSDYELTRSLVEEAGEYLDRIVEDEE